MPRKYASNAARQAAYRVRKANAETADARQTDRGDRLVARVMAAHAKAAESAT